MNVQSSVLAAEPTGRREPPGVFELDEPVFDELVFDELVPPAAFDAAAPPLETRDCFQNWCAHPVPQKRSIPSGSDSPYS
jgi:hypothetical protein